MSLKVGCQENICLNFGNTHSYALTLEQGFPRTCYLLQKIELPFSLNLAIQTSSEALDCFHSETQATWLICLTSHSYSKANNALFLNPPRSSRMVNCRGQRRGREGPLQRDKRQQLQAIHLSLKAYSQQGCHKTPEWPQGQNASDRKPLSQTELKLVEYETATQITNKTSGNCDQGQALSCQTSSASPTISSGIRQSVRAKSQHFVLTFKND